MKNGYVAFALALGLGLSPSSARAQTAPGGEPGPGSAGFFSLDDHVLPAVVVSGMTGGLGSESGSVRS